MGISSSVFTIGKTLAILTLNGIKSFLVVLGVTYWTEYPILYFPHADVLKIMFPLHRVPVFSLTFVFAVQADCNRQSKHDLLIPDSGRLPRAASLVSSSLHNAHTHVHKNINIQGVFFYWSALKMTKCQTLRKF